MKELEIKTFISGSDEQLQNQLNLLEDNNYKIENLIFIGRSNDSNFEWKIVCRELD